MAEGGSSRSSPDINITTGSECVYDFYCELCRDDGLNEEASGYCNNCEEYLCGSCIHAHKKSRPTRHHNVLDQQSMPKDTPLSQDRISKDISTNCQLHRNKTVEFYCPSHDKLGCSTCFATVHKTCAEIESVYEKSEDIIDSQEYVIFSNNLKDMDKRACVMIEQSQHNVAALERNSSNIINDIRSLKAEFIAVFDELEGNLITQVETLVSEDKASIERLERDLAELKNSVESLRSEFEGLVNSKRACQLYIRMKENKSDIAALEEKLDNAKANTKVGAIEFVPNNDIKNAIQTSGFGKITHNKCEKDAHYVDHANNDEHTVATHIADINVKSSIDYSKCYITGTVSMSDTTLITVDSNNNSVKIVDTQSNKIKCELRLYARLFDVTVVNHEQVIVSTWGHGKMFLINVGETLSIESEFEVGRGCRGITFSQNKLFVAVYDPPSIVVMDLRGKVIKRLSINALLGPRYICCSNDYGSMYISDEKSKRVFRVSFDGKATVKSVYCDLRCPSKLCLDHCGNVYIAGYIAKSVHMVNADCCKIKEILTQRDGLGETVTSVSHCRKTNRLYVGMDGSNVVKVYQLS